MKATLCFKARVRQLLCVCVHEGRVFLYKLVLFLMESSIFLMWYVLVCTVSEGKAQKKRSEVPI